jgi:hypothetical protein
MGDSDEPVSPFKDAVASILTAESIDPIAKTPVLVRVSLLQDLKSCSYVEANAPQERRCLESTFALFRALTLFRPHRIERLKAHRI